MEEVESLRTGFNQLTFEQKQWMLNASLDLLQATVDKHSKSLSAEMTKKERLATALTMSEIHQLIYAYKDALLKLGRNPNAELNELWAEVERYLGAKDQPVAPSQ